eukprot:768487-Hanusia_phi.AAC.1
MAHCCSRQRLSVQAREEQRYFVLYEGLLAYWADEKDFVNKKRPKGVIELSECSLATAEQHTKRLNTIGDNLRVEWSRVLVCKGSKALLQLFEHGIYV